MKFLNFKPSNHYIHLEIVKIAEVTEGKIIIPVGLKDKLGLYRVINTGPGFYDAASGQRLPMSCKAGDYVLIDPEKVTTLAYAGQKIHVVEDQHVLGVLEYNGEEGSIADETSMLPSELARQKSVDNPNTLVTDTTGAVWRNGARVHDPV